jgi:hypothetical protein
MASSMTVKIAAFAADADDQRQHRRERVTGRLAQLMES